MVAYHVSTPVDLAWAAWKLVGIVGAAYALGCVTGFVGTVVWAVLSG